MGFILAQLLDLLQDFYPGQLRWLREETLQTWVRVLILELLLFLFFIGSLLPILISSLLRWLAKSLNRMSLIFKRGHLLPTRSLQEPSYFLLKAILDE